MKIMTNRTINFKKDIYRPFSALIIFVLVQFVSSPPSARASDYSLNYTAGSKDSFLSLVLQAAFDLVYYI